MSIIKTIAPFHEDYYRNSINLEQELPQIKAVLVGKKLNKILNRVVWDTIYNNDWDSTISYENVHNIFFEDFEFVIGEDMLEVDICGPSYRIGVNNDKIEKIYPTENIPLKDWVDCGYKVNSEYNDISYIYDFLIGCEITDI